MSLLDSLSKITDPFFFQSGLSLFLELYTYKGHNEICNQDISKTIITARSFTLAQLIEDKE